MIFTERWKQYLLSEQKNKKRYSFDYDSTLIVFDMIKDKDGDIDLRYMGPHEENIEKLIELSGIPNSEVYIVTSRHKPVEGRKPHFDESPSPEQLVKDLGLKVKQIIYTEGQPKVNVLKKLGISKHWDDDQVEIDAIESYNNDNPDNKIQYQLVPRNNIPYEVNENRKKKYRAFFDSIK